MAVKIKHKSRRGRGGRKPNVKPSTRFKGEAEKALNEAISRLNPRPNAGNWKKMARGLAAQKSQEIYFDAFLAENEGDLGWEWAALWIAHTFLCEAGLVDVADQMYATLCEHFPRNYNTELAYGRMIREHKAEYFVARDHLRFATTLWPEGCEAFYQLGILYDMLGLPEFAFAMEDIAYSHADQHGDVAYKLKAQLSFNQAVAMWQAARPYGDIKAYLRRALENWPGYERAEKFLNSLPDNDEADPRGRSAMQRMTDDVRTNMNRPVYNIIEPDTDEE